MKPEDIPQSLVARGAERLAAGYWQAPDGTPCRPDEIAHAVLSGALSGHRLAWDDEVTRERQGAALARLYMEWGVVTGWGDSDSADGPGLEEFIARIVDVIEGDEDA